MGQHPGIWKIKKIWIFFIDLPKVVLKSGKKYDIIFSKDTFVADLNAANAAASGSGVY